LNRLAPTQVELEIPISPEDLAAAEDRAFRKLAKNVRLPGFRAGKVPRKVFEQTYGAQTIVSQAIEDVVPAAYGRAVREHDLEPVDRPKMEVVDEADGRPRLLKATVEVRPEIALGEYKGLAAAGEPEAVTDEDVDRSITALAKERATLIPVERPAAMGDVVTMDYRGAVDGEAFEGGSAEGQVTELAEGRFIPGFIEGIVGSSAGEQREVAVRFPDDYGEATLAGKDAVFAITVHDVKALELPAIDDAFASSISPNETLEALKADVRARLETIAASRARRATGNVIMEQLLEAHDFPLPASMVDAEVDSMINDATSSAAQVGATFEQYLEQAGKTEEELRAELRPDAEKRVKGTLLIEEIAKREQIAATPADVGEELAALARQYGQPVDRIRKALGNNVLSLMDGIVRNKTLEFLVDNAAKAAGEATSTSEE
jgi:trigger factor